MTATEVRRLFWGYIGNEIFSRATGLSLITVSKIRNGKIPLAKSSVFIVAMQMANELKRRNIFPREFDPALLVMDDQDLIASENRSKILVNEATSI